MYDQFLFRAGVLALAVALLALYVAVRHGPLTPREAGLAVGVTLAVAGIFGAEAAGKIPAYKLRPTGLVTSLMAALILIAWLWRANSNVSDSGFMTIVLIGIPVMLIGSALYVGTAKPPK